MRTPYAPGPLILLLAALSCAPLRTTEPSAGDAGWVNATLSRLTLRQKVAQLVIPRIGGAFLPADGPAYERIRDWVQVQGVGGVIATIGPPMEAATTFNMIQSLADVPLLITADMEHGPGQLLNGGVVLPYGLENGSATRFPPVMAIGATGDERLAYQLGRITALEGRAVGVHMTFAPVVDVNNNPANPIINTRSYGADPRLVARLATAHIRGVQENGMLATAKHFPGHGDTGTDSHIELPIITVSKARADSIELVPYRTAIAAGVAAVMSAHIAFPALTGDTLPATLNPRILTGLLRQELGFRGLITTDAMDMGAIVKRWGSAAANIMALKAGADLLLQVPASDVTEVIDAVTAAVQRGELTEARIDESVRRVLDAKARLGLHRQRKVDLERVPFALARADHIALAQEAADRSITAVRDRDRLLPVRAERVLSLVYAGDVDPFAGRVFQRTLGEGIKQLSTALLDATPSEAELERVRTLAKDADLVIFAPFIRVQAYRPDLAVAEPVAALLTEIARSRPTVIVSFGNPYVLGQFPDVGTYVVAWGQWDAPQRAAGRALTGRIPITGKLPIPIPPFHLLGDGIVVDASTPDAAPASPLRARDRRTGSPLSLARAEGVGMDPELGARVDRLLNEAILEGAAPGAAVAIGRYGQLVHLAGYGRLDPREGFGPVTDSTIYDLASLTKVIATTTAAMLLVDAGRLDLDAPVSRYLPEWQGQPEKRAVTVRNLLLHNAGLPAWAPLFRDLRGRHAYREAITSMRLSYTPGTQSVYSDMGAILLGFIIEEITVQSLDRFVQERVFGPLGMHDTGFNPEYWTWSLPPENDAARNVFDRIAPSEKDTVLRFDYVQGQVHDENAWAIGGVAGHAGLFSSARDLAVFAQFMLDGGMHNSQRLIRESTVRQFTRRESSASSRALGWDTPFAGSSAGDYFSAASFGHTGFTGTSIWIDPERDLFVVLLMNRLNPTRTNEKYIPIRRQLSNIVQQAVLDMPPARRIQ